MKKSSFHFSILLSFWLVCDHHSVIISSHFLLNIPLDTPNQQRSSTKASKMEIKYTVYLNNQRESERKYVAMIITIN